MGQRQLPKQALIALHRYFIWADRMRVHFETALTPDSPMLHGRLDIEPFLYMSIWYAGMYVVIEGWRKLGLHDAGVDQMLESPNVELLRRYRNGVFHFQPDYFAERFAGFFGSPDGPRWIRELRAAFSRYFLDSMKGIT